MTKPKFELFQKVYSAEQKYGAFIPREFVIRGIRQIGNVWLYNPTGDTKRWMPEGCLRATTEETQEMCDQKQCKTFIKPVSPKKKKKQNYQRDFEAGIRGSFTEKRYKNENIKLSKSCFHLKRLLNICLASLSKRKKVNKVDAIFKSILRRAHVEIYREIVDEMRRQKII
jgi:hypothetical protein